MKSNRNREVIRKGVTGTRSTRPIVGRVRRGRNRNVEKRGVDRRRGNKKLVEARRIGVRTLDVFSKMKISVLIVWDFRNTKIFFELAKAT